MPVLCVSVVIIMVAVVVVVCVRMCAGAMVTVCINGVWG